MILVGGFKAGLAIIKLNNKLVNMNANSPVVKEHKVWKDQGLGLGSQHQLKQ